MSRIYSAGQCEVLPDSFAVRGPDGRAAAKFAHHEDERAVEQAAFFEIGDNNVQRAVYAGQRRKQHQAAISADFDIGFQVVHDPA